MTPEKVQQMTKDERRDWLAEAQGWTRDGERWLHDIMKTPHTYFEGHRYYDHPIEDALDEAANCLPEGWVWERQRGTDMVGCWAAWKLGGEPYVSIPATNDETNDRFALAILAISAT